MGAVVPFTNPARVNERTLGLAVVVAPRGDLTVALVRTARGWRVLEETPDRDHAIEDGRRYAARFGLPFREQDEPFIPEASPPPGEPSGGEVYLVPSDRNGGSWDVVHESRYGDSSAIVGNAYSFEKAVAKARRIAREMGATFDDGAPGPGAA